MTDRAFQCIGCEMEEVNSPPLHLKVVYSGPHSAPQCCNREEADPEWPS